MTPARETWLGAALGLAGLLAGTVGHFWKLGSAPPAPPSDLAAMSYQASARFTGRAVPEAALRRAVGPMDLVFPVPIALARLTSRWTGYTPQAFLGWGAGLGWLIIPAMYLYGRARFGHLEAGLAAFLCGTSLWPAGLHRMGYPAVSLSPLIALWAFVSLPALRTGGAACGPVSFGLSLAAAGLAGSLYLAPLPVVLTLGALALPPGARPAPRRVIAAILTGLAAYLAGAVLYAWWIGAAPLSVPDAQILAGSQAGAHRGVLAPTMNPAWVTGRLVTLMKELFWRSGGVFDPTDGNVTGATLVHPAVAAALLAGVWTALRRRRPDDLILCLWAGGFLLIAAAGFTPQPRRLLPAAPAFFLLASLPLAALCRARPGLGLATAVVAGGLSAAAAWTALSRPADLWVSFRHAATLPDIARALKSIAPRPETTAIVLDSAYPELNFHLLTDARFSRGTWPGPLVEPRVRNGPDWEARRFRSGIRTIVWITPNDPSRPFRRWLHERGLDRHAALVAGPGGVEAMIASQTAPGRGPRS